VVQARITSGAPLTYARITGFPSAPSIAWKVAMNLYSESKGILAILGVFRRNSSTCMPPFSARTQSAPSVGSPITSPSLISVSIQSAQGKRTWSRFSSASPSVHSIRPSKL